MTMSSSPEPAGQVGPILSTRDRRRFTAVLMSHPAFDDVGAVAAKLGLEKLSLSRSRVEAAGWVNYDAQVPYRRLYPRHHEAAPERARGDEFLHDVFFALHIDDGMPLLFIAAPYVELLDWLVTGLRRSYNNQLRFIAIDMAALFDVMSTGLENMSPRRVTMQILNEDNVELISLTGRMPLHSDVHASLRGSTEPYGVGVEVRVDDNAKCRVTVNRAGVFHWFQAHEGLLRCPLWLYLELESRDLILKERRPVRIRPSSKDEAEDDS